MSSEIRPRFYELLCSYTGWTLRTVYRSERASERTKSRIASRHAFPTYAVVPFHWRLAAFSLPMHGTVPGKFRCHGAASLYSGE